jgi:hypothetical protein
MNMHNIKPPPQAQVDEWTRNLGNNFDKLCHEMILISAADSGVREAVIAVPVYSLKDNSAIAGVWGGSIDFNVLNKELQSFNLTSLDDNTRVVYVDSNGQKVADSDINKSATPESFANLTSFRGETEKLVQILIQ